MRRAVIHRFVRGLRPWAGKRCGMKSIFTLLKANIRYKKGAFTSIALLMMIITFSFSGTVSNNDNLERAFSDSLENYEIGDLIVTVHSSDADELIEKSERSIHVKKAHEEQRIAVNTDIESEGKTLSAIFRIACFDSRVRVFDEDIKGYRENVIPENGEVYLSYAFAKSSNLTIGSELVIKTSSGDEKFKVAGYTEDPVYGSGTIIAEHLFVSPDDYERISEKADNEDSAFRCLEKISMIHIMSTGDMELSKLPGVLNRECGLIDKAVLYIDKDELSENIMYYSAVGTKLLAVFVILLTGVVIIMIHNSIKSSLELEYVNIGILKSQGFTVWQIRMVYVIQYTAALIIGTAAGIIVSFPLVSTLEKSFIQLTDILTTGDISVLKCTGMAMVIVLVCIVSVVISSSGISRVSPVRAINGGHEDIYFTGRTNFRIRKNGINFYLSLRQLVSCRASNAGTVLITAILVFFMISISIFSKSIDSGVLTSDYLNVRAVFSAFSNFEYSDTDIVREAVSGLDSKPDILFYANPDNVSTDDVIYNITVTDRPEHFAKAYKGRVPKYPNEIAITGIMEESADKHIGDTVTVHANGLDCDYIITGIYQTLDSMGRTFIMTMDGGNRLDINIEAGMVLMEECSEKEITEVTELLNSRFGDILAADKYVISDSEQGYIDMVDGLLNIVSFVVSAVSVVFALVVVTSMCRRAVMREKKNIGVYRSVGFKDSSLRLNFALRYMILSLTGSATGAVMALMLSGKMFSAMLSSFGITNFISKFSVSDILVPSAIITVCCFVFAWFASSGVKKVEISSLITE